MPAQRRRGTKSFQIYPDPPTDPAQTSSGDNSSESANYRICPSIIVKRINEDGSITPEVPPDIFFLSPKSHIEEWRRTIAMWHKVPWGSLRIFKDERAQARFEDERTGKQEGVRWGSAIYFKINEEWDDDGRILRQKMEALDRRPRRTGRIRNREEEKEESRWERSVSDV